MPRFGVQALGLALLAGVARGLARGGAVSMARRAPIRTPPALAMGVAGAESYDGGGSGRMGPPPDMPSLMLNNRIVYLGMAINAAVAQLVVAELLYLQFESDLKPVFMYINSPGLITEGRQLVGIETEGFAILDTMGYVKAPISTICVGKAFGAAALMLASGDKGKRAVMPFASVMLQQPLSQAQGQASDIRISALETKYMREQSLAMLAARTGQSLERVAADSSRQFYLDAPQAVEYGIADRIMARDGLRGLTGLGEMPTALRSEVRGIA